MTPQQLFGVAVRAIGLWQLIEIINALHGAVSTVAMIVAMPNVHGFEGPLDHLRAYFIVGIGLMLRVAIGCVLFFKADRIVALAYPAWKTCAEPQTDGGDVHFPQ
ncbi:MAG TPA: hypothetical protein VGN12_00355 [Pirellulales bacterium]|jgi:hypothetical protein